MHQESSQYLNRLPRVFRLVASAPFVLFGFRKNRPFHLSIWAARSPLIHSYGYVSADDRIDYSAPFPLKPEPFMNYPGEEIN